MAAGGGGRGKCVCRRSTRMRRWAATRRDRRIGFSINGIWSFAFGRTRMFWKRRSDYSDQFGDFGRAGLRRRKTASDYSDQFEFEWEMREFGGERELGHRRCLSGAERGNYGVRESGANGRRMSFSGSVGENRPSDFSDLFAPGERTGVFRTKGVSDLSDQFDFGCKTIEFERSSAFGHAGCWRGAAEPRG
jgi:hypothetical protein